MEVLGMIHYYCVACGNRENLHNHHLIPRSCGGSDDEYNLITLCGNCHAKIHGLEPAWANHIVLTTESLQRKKAKGERVGAVPYGKALAADGVALVDNETEQDVIAEARKLHATGISLRKIAVILAEKGFQARNGRAFAATQIQRMVA